MLGLSTGTSSTRTPYEKKMMNAFGKHFVNVRSYLSARAIYDEGITPTTDDLAEMAEGKVPTSLRSDATHLNDNGYHALATLIYWQGKSLGYWD